jgi:hypothetical protein
MFLQDPTNHQSLPNWLPLLDSRVWRENCQILQILSGMIFFSFCLFSVLKIALIMPVCGAAVNHESLSLFCNIVVGTSRCAAGVTS